MRGLGREGTCEGIREGRDMRGLGREGACEGIREGRGT